MTHLLNRSCDALAIQLADVPSENTPTIWVTMICALNELLTRLNIRPNPLDLNQTILISN